MPMPVSLTENATTPGAALSTGWSGVHPPAAGAICSVTRPRSVNLSAFESRFLSTCCRRFGSVCSSGGRFGARSTVKLSRLVSATGRNVRSSSSRTAVKSTGPASTVTVPDSIFARSRMSLISVRRSLPAP